LAHDIGCAESRGVAAVIAAANFGTEFAEALQSKIPFWNGEFSSVVRQWSKIESSVTHNRALIGQPCAGCETLRTGLNLTLQATAKFVLKAGIEPRGDNKNHVEKLLTNWCDLSDAVSSHCLDSHKDGLYRLDGHQSGCIDGLYSSLDEDEEPSTRHLFDRLHNTLNDPYHENPKYDQFGYASKIQTKAGLRIKAHKDSLAASTRVLKTMYDVNKTDRRRLRDLANLGSLLSGFADLR
jgi:hypothetical protein